MAQELMAYLKEREQFMLKTLQQVVELESPSDNKEAVDRLVSYLADHLTALGAGVELVEQSEVGNHLKAVLDSKGTGGQILVLSHIDTVWPLGTIEERPFRIEGDRAYGPGIFDMKTGAVQVLYAVRAIKELGLRLPKRVVMLFTSDEEIGSPTSRAVIEGEARQSDAALVLEPSVPPYGALKTSRKGVGAFKLIITGKAAHAGSDPDKGISAVEELAHQILHLKALAAPDKGTTVNVGVVRGGSRSNVVAAHAEAEIDVRVVTPEESRRISRDMLRVKQFVPGTEVQISGGIKRPPMVRSKDIVALFNKACDLAQDLGFELQEASSGGGSDGNFTAAMGVPTLDGLGAVGDGAHAVHEHILISHLVPRTALLVRLLQTL